MKGWEIARLVRQIDPAFPVVYVTGAAADDWASEGVRNSILLTKAPEDVQVIPFRPTFFDTQRSMPDVAKTIKEV